MWTHCTQPKFKVIDECRVEMSRMVVNQKKYIDFCNQSSSTNTKKWQIAHLFLVAQVSFFRLYKNSFLIQKLAEGKSDTDGLQFEMQAFYMGYHLMRTLRIYQFYNQQFTFTFTPQTPVAESIHKLRKKFGLDLTKGRVH